MNTPSKNSTNSVSVWEIPKLTFKSYPCGSISHPYMDCVLTLRQKYAILPERVAEIVCRTAEGPVHRLWEPLEQKRRPPTSYAAKFSLPFSIAVMLIRGRAGLEEFSDEAIQDAGILALAKKVRYELDPTIDYPRHFSGHVKIKLIGRYDPRGEPTLSARRVRIAVAAGGDRAKVSRQRSLGVAGR